MIAPPFLDRWVSLVPPFVHYQSLYHGFFDLALPSQVSQDLQITVVALFGHPYTPLYSVRKCQSFSRTYTKVRLQSDNGLCRELNTSWCLGIVLGFRFHVNTKVLGRPI